MRNYPPTCFYDVTRCRYARYIDVAYADKGKLLARKRRITRENDLRPRKTIFVGHAATIQFPSRYIYFYLTDATLRVMDTQKASHIGIQNSIVHWCNFHRALSAQRCAEPTYIITWTFITIVYTLQILTLIVSYFFIVCMKRHQLEVNF